MEINHENWSEHAAKVQHALDFIGDKCRVLAVQFADPFDDTVIHVIDNSADRDTVSMLGRLGGIWSTVRATTHVQRTLDGVVLLAVLNTREWEQVFGTRPVRDSVDFGEVPDAD